MSRRMGWCAMVLSLSFVASASAVTQGIPLTNGDFELPGPAGTKVVAFNETGVPFAPTDPVVTLPEGGLAGGIPGWTFTGGDGGLGEACPGSGLGCELFGDNIPGDSGTEGKGLGLPGNELLLSTVDGKVFQTSGFSLPASPLPTTQKLLLSFDAVNVFTPAGTNQLSAWLYYVNGGGSRVMIGSPLNVNTLTAAPQKFSLEFIGGSAALTPALGRPIGVSFDTTSREFDALVTESWAGVDNVLVEIAGTSPGDFNGDGSINLTDYAIIRDNLEESHNYLVDGDIVRNGFVDLNDFRAWTLLPSVINSGVLAEIAAIPEPSSMVLILVSTIAGAFSRRRFGISDRACALLLAVVGGLMVAMNGSTASAALLAYDPFLTGANPALGQYTVGPLVTAIGNGQNPTIGPTPFFTGGWDGGAADSLATQVQATGLSFLGSPAGGGSIQSGIVDGTGASRPGRRMASPWTATTNGTYYISFLMNFGGVGVNPNGTRDDVAHRAIELWDESGNIGDGSAVLRIGYMSYNGNFNSLPPSQAPLKAGPFGQELIIEGGPASFLEDNGSTHLFVLKFEFSDQAASDTVSIYLDPTENEEPIIAGAVFPGLDFTLGAIGGPVQFGGGGTPMVFDELRVADTFEDALPEFPRKGNTNPEIDDFVDIADYNAIITHMNLTGMTTSQGDVTGDGRVDLRDLRLWRDNRTDIGPLAGDISVPEPASAALLAFALLPLFGRGRRS